MRPDALIGGGMTLTGRIISPVIFWVYSLTMRGVLTWGTERDPGVRRIM